MKTTLEHKYSFDSLDNIPFRPEEYSRLKFGDDVIAMFYGTELANMFADKHMDTLIANDCVVIPSPYNEVKNAATIMTQYFVRELNRLLVNRTGKHVQTSIIHRKISYVNDYGFLTKEGRMGLIANDKFYLNKGFYENKILIFIDDVRITGTHEETILDVLQKEQIQNDSYFLYYGNYTGEDAAIESRINLAGIKTVDDYLECLVDPSNHVIVRTIKFFLKIPNVSTILDVIPRDKIEALYFGAMAEGYYKIPQYQQNFQALKHYLF